MGFLDNVLGGLTGSGSNSQMSGLSKALIALLAAKAASSYFNRSSATTPQAVPQGAPAGGGGQINSGMLTGLPNLDTILNQFRGAGHEDKVQSWIGTGQNAPVDPNDVGSALGPQAIDHLQQQTGLPRDQLLSQLSSLLPQIIDKLTPNGRLPAPDETRHW